MDDDALWSIVTASGLYALKLAVKLSLVVASGRFSNVSDGSMADETKL